MYNAAADLSEPRFSLILAFHRHAYLIYLRLLSVPVGHGKRYSIYPRPNREKYSIIDSERSPCVQRFISMPVCDLGNGSDVSSILFPVLIFVNRSREKYACYLRLIQKRNDWICEFNFCRRCSRIMCPGIYFHFVRYHK